jgi:hypothetical protein
MFCREGRSSILKTLVLATALLLCPCVALAQRHGAGGATSGSGMSSVGRPTGVDQKDDLKDFHDALAVQATSQQIIEYTSMVKATAAASAELQVLLEQLDRRDNASALTSRGATLEQALEKARTENKNFLGGFSGPQKSGLKEITKKLTRADSELAQRSQEVNQKMADTKPVSEVIASLAQNLAHALASFQNQQATLGQEMGIVDPDSQDFTFHISPVKNSISFQDQPIAIVTSGVIAKSAAQAGQNTFTIKLTEDVSDLQQNITEVLRTQLDKADRCGERIAIRNATLTPMTPASQVVIQLHFERWTCFGGQNNEIAEGDGSLEVNLSPAVGEDGTLRLTPTMGRIDAEGLLGESLHTGSLGPELRDKIAECILSTVRPGVDFKVLLPPAAQGSARLHQARFQSTGAGALTVVLDGDIRVSNEKATALVSELKERTSSEQNPLQQSMPR